MTRHLFHPQHLPHPHVAGPIAAFVEHALETVHREHWHSPPERTVPAAADWPDWSYADAQSPWEYEK